MDTISGEIFNLERGYMIADKIAECYQAAMRLFGSEFRSKTDAIRAAIQELMDKSGCNEVSAGLAVMKLLREKNKLSGMAIMLVAAVTYDVMENGD